MISVILGVEYHHKLKINMLQKFSGYTSQEMNRKEFLQHVGIGMALLFGGEMIIRMFGLNGPKPIQDPRGYGRSNYGGK